MTIHEVVQLCGIILEAWKACNSEAITRGWCDLSPRDKLTLLSDWLCAYGESHSPGLNHLRYPPDLGIRGCEHPERYTRALQ